MGIDFQHFIADPGFDVLFLSEFPGGPGNQTFDVADNLADIVGNSSSGIGRKRAALKGRNFKLRVSAAGL